MDNALPWPFGRIFGARRVKQTARRAAVRFGGDKDDEPVFVGAVSGPIEIEMAKDALREAEIPALVKQNSVGTIYGFTGGAFGSAEVWALPVFANHARDLLVGMGLIEDDSGDSATEEERDER